MEKIKVGNTVKIKESFLIGIKDPSEHIINLIGKKGRVYHIDEYGIEVMINEDRYTVDIEDCKKSKPDKVNIYSLLSENILTQIIFELEKYSDGFFYEHNEDYNVKVNELRNALAIYFYINDYKVDRQMYRLFIHYNIGNHYQKFISENPNKLVKRLVMIGDDIKWLESDNNISRIIP